MTPRPPSVEDLAHAHGVILDLIDEIERGAPNRSSLAEELSQTLAQHRCSCTEYLVASLERENRDQFEPRTRQLLSATRGADQLADRLRLPDRDAAGLSHVLSALRAMLREHVRIELELAQRATDGSTVQ